jgi:uncharacterized protein with PIN domain
MAEEIHNHGDIEKQVNINDHHGDIVLTQKSRFAKRFEKLNQEVESNERYDGIMEAFEEYITKLDGVGLEKKLEDCGFSNMEIVRATKKKLSYAKKQQKNRFYESAQWIDTQLFAMIQMNFETYVDMPLIQTGATKQRIIAAVVEHVVKPTFDLLNKEGEHDRVLNYTLEDIFGMVYYLTGMCHLNWANYDNV